MDALWWLVGDGRQIQVLSMDVETEAFAEVHRASNDHHAPEHRRHPAKGHDSRHHAIEDAFARDVASWLDHAALERRFDKVAIVLPPAFLGQLRSHLRGAASRVAVSMALDLAQLGPSELARRLTIVAHESGMVPKPAAPAPTTSRPAQ